jgi:hypothetical protein
VKGGDKRLRERDLRTEAAFRADENARGQEPRFTAESRCPPHPGRSKEYILPTS